MEPRHRAIAEIALAAAGVHGLALAGGYAVREHGIGHRPSGDIDLFTDWHRRADFPAVVEKVIAGLEQHGYRVATVARGETFARMLVNAPGDGPETEPEKLELSADWRSHPPVLLDIGPVLHPDDAVTNKVCALYGRALARDFLDVDAIVESGRYSREQLLRFAEAADPGFDRAMFALALGALTQITDTAFADYGTPSDEVAALRRRFGQWRGELTGG